MNREIKLYSWQKECRDIWVNNNTRGIIQVVTGAGKTIFALSCLEKLPRKTKIKIVVPTVALVKQWKATIKEYVKENDIGQYYGNIKNRSNHRFMIYVVNSARYAISNQVLKDMEDGYDVFLIYDECHHYGSEENQKIFHFINSINFRKDKYHCLGLSATPECHNLENVLIPYIGPIIYNYNFSNALEAQQISNYYLYQISTVFTNAEEYEYNNLTGKIVIAKNILLNAYPELKSANKKDFLNNVSLLCQKDDELAMNYLSLLSKRDLLRILANNRIKCTIDLIHEIEEEKRIIIFSERIEQAKELYDSLIKDYPNKVCLYHSKMDKNERKNVLDDFKNNQKTILISCKALDEGIDIPDIDIGIILSSTGVTRQRIQRLGRIIRKNNRKFYSVLYYIFIKGSNDKTSYLKNTDSLNRVINIKYQDHTFINDFYLSKAKELLDSLSIKDKKRRQEVERCLSIGLLRPDVYLPKEALKELEYNAEEQKTKNYYYCVYLLSQYIMNLNKENDNHEI